MIEPPSIQLALRSDPPCLCAVREEVRAWLVQQGWHSEQACELVLALDEALSNVIRHGYDGRRDEPIDVSISIVNDAGQGEGVEVRVRDYGRQVDPAAICGRDLDDIRPGGLGVHIIRSMTSSAAYAPAPGGGMLLVMRKYKSHWAKQHATQDHAS